MVYFISGKAFLLLVSHSLVGACGGVLRKHCKEFSKTYQEI